MNNELYRSLSELCSKFLNELENITSHIPYGTCYLLGHCLAEGFSKIGSNARETTGNLILQDKHRKSIVYGKSKYHGKLVGYFHTWCILKLDDEEIIVDPSMKYIKMYLKKYCNIKLNERLPDILISNKSHLWHYEYIEDNSLVSQSRLALNRQDPKIVTHLINTVRELSDSYLINTSQIIRKSA